MVCISACAATLSVWALPLHYDMIYNSRPQCAEKAVLLRCTIFIETCVYSVDRDMQYILLGRLQHTCCVVQLAYAVSPIKLLAKDDSLYSWRERMLKAYDNPQKAHGQKGFPESLE